MLAQAIVNNEEKVVYTCPAGKKAYIFLHIYAPSTSNTIIKINDIIYFSDGFSGLFIEKLNLDAGDTIKVSTDSAVNVFIDGMEV
jgi:hypothetical protein